MAGSGSLSPMRIRACRTGSTRPGSATVSARSGGSGRRATTHRARCPSRARNRSRSPAGLDYLGDTEDRAGELAARQAHLCWRSHMTPASGSTNSRLRSGLEHDARLTPAGRCSPTDSLQRLVDGANAIDTAFAEDPTIAAERIVEPIFVIGAPERARRRCTGFSPPTPPPGPRRMGIPLPDRPRHPDVIGAAADELGWPQAQQAGIRAIHTYDARMERVPVGNSRSARRSS